MDRTPRRRARARHGRLPGPGLEPSARGPRGRLCARAGGRAERRRPCRRPPPRPHRTHSTHRRPLPAGRPGPLPRIEDAVRIGELLRRAALAQFGWRHDVAAGRSIPLAPWEISGRDAGGKPLQDPSHPHAFWLPEDADGDGWIDHVSVFIAGGMNRDVQARLDLITRLWLAPKQRSDEVDAEPGAVKEWRLALEGFGRPADFAGGARIFGTSRYWRSVTPFLASGHLKAGRLRGRGPPPAEAAGAGRDGHRDHRPAKHRGRWHPASRDPLPPFPFPWTRGPA